MPPSFFSNLADKAQSALNASPLAQHMPAGLTNRTDSTASGESASQGGVLKSHAFESIQHQLRTFQQQYSSSTSAVQRIITSEKGIALQLDSVSRDTHSHSKELYVWGQNEPEDLKDVSDRLAWLNYIQGSLAHTLATKLDAARTPLKELRDAENALAPRRNIRASFRTQIARIEHDQQRGMEKKLGELKAQLQKAEQDDESQEKEIELLKRKALRESEQLKWEAFKEYAEKLSLVSQAAAAVIPALPPIPPSKAQPYTGVHTTASIRAILQQTLDNYKPGTTELPLGHRSAADLSRSDTRSFGETHAKELSRINTPDMPSLPLTPPSPGSPPPPQVSVPAAATGASASASTPPPLAPRPSPPSASQSPVINPADLNQSPAPVPIPSNAAPVVTVPDLDPTTKVSSAMPTVAETGVPKSAGPDGPGPSSGSLLDLKPSSPTSAKSPLAEAKSPYGVIDHNPPDYGVGRGASLSLHDTAIDEKKRLEREERERVLHGESVSVASDKPKYESAAEEKKRLEKEDREKILAAGGSSNSGPPPPPRDGEEPPSYDYGF